MRKIRDAMMCSLFETVSKSVTGFSPFSNNF
ncbi:hypothetical protein Dip510_001672 [Elusimicrobium posterum]